MKPEEKSQNEEIEKDVSSSQEQKKKPQEVQGTDENSKEKQEQKPEVTTEEKPKPKKRGRPKGSTNKNTAQKEEKPKSPDSIEQQIEEELKAFNNISPITEEEPQPQAKPKKRRGRPRKKREAQETKITGMMLLSFINIFVPGLIVTVYGFIDKRAKQISPEDLTLTHSEKLELEESADEVAKMLFADLNPIYLFTFGLLAAFGSKLQAELKQIPK